MRHETDLAEAQLTVLCAANGTGRDGRARWALDQLADSRLRLCATIRCAWLPQLGRICTSRVAQHASKTVIVPRRGMRTTPRPPSSRCANLFSLALHKTIFLGTCSKLAINLEPSADDLQGPPTRKTSVVPDFRRIRAKDGVPSAQSLPDPGGDLTLSCRCNGFP